MLYPLTLPPTIPLWMAAAGIVFGVIIGKEVFGGVGHEHPQPGPDRARVRVLHLPGGHLGRAKVWDVGGSQLAAPNWDNSTVVDGYTGATPLLTPVSRAPTPAPTALDALRRAAASAGPYSDLALGADPRVHGRGERHWLPLLGAVFLIMASGIASWRTMVACVVGLLGMAAVLNGVAGPDIPALFYLPPHYHLVMGGFAFGAVFMATDPVSSSGTRHRQWIYGIAIGALCVLVRVVNPAYPEGMMLAILFMNVFAPLIDYYVVVRRPPSRRAEKRLAAGLGAHNRTMATFSIRTATHTPSASPLPSVWCAVVAVRCTSVACLLRIEHPDRTTTSGRRPAGQHPELRRGSSPKTVPAIDRRGDRQADGTSGSSSAVHRTSHDVEGAWTRPRSTRTVTADVDPRR